MRVCLYVFLISGTAVHVQSRQERGALGRRDQVSERMETGRSCSLHDLRTPGTRKRWVTGERAREVKGLGGPWMPR